MITNALNTSKVRKAGDQTSWARYFALITLEASTLSGFLFCDSLGFTQTSFKHAISSLKACLTGSNYNLEIAYSLSRVNIPAYPQIQLIRRGRMLLVYWIIDWLTLYNTVSKIFTVWTMYNSVSLLLCGELISKSSYQFLYSHSFRRTVFVCLELHTTSRPAAGQAYQRRPHPAQTALGHTYRPVTCACDVCIPHSWQGQQ